MVLNKMIKKENIFVAEFMKIASKKKKKFD